MSTENEPQLRPKVYKIEVKQFGLRKHTIRVQRGKRWTAKG